MVGDLMSGHYSCLAYLKCSRNIEWPKELWGWGELWGWRRVTGNGKTDSLARLAIMGTSRLFGVENKR